jgi:hypothetical protein
LPRLAACHRCGILQRLPDVHPKTPLVPARLEWTSGEQYIYKDDKGLPVMVPAYDPVLEDFMLKHEHGAQEQQVLAGEVINVWTIDQKTWDSMDVVTKIKSELQDQTNRHYEDQDTYRTGAVACYNDHGNPTMESGCPDYLDDSKRIGPAQYNDDGHVITVPPQFRQYLCYLCPYQQSVIQVELRRRRGLYDINKTYDRRAKARKKARR